MELFLLTKVQFMLSSDNFPLQVDYSHPPPPHFIFASQLWTVNPWLAESPMLAMQQWVLKLLRLFLHVYISVVSEANEKRGARLMRNHLDKQKNDPSSSPVPTPMHIRRQDR